MIAQETFTKENLKEQVKCLLKNIFTSNYSDKDLKSEVDAFRNFKDKDCNFENGELLDYFVDCQNSRMEERNIRFRHEITMKETFECINNTDVLGLLKHLMDNAVEACEKIQNKNSRWICLRIFEDKDFLNIRLRNSIKDTRLSEEDKMRHGNGAKHINDILENYDCHVSIQDYDYKFNIVIQIPIRELKKMED